MKSQRISFWFMVLGPGGLGYLFFTSMVTLQAIEVVWTGLGTTDRWADPNNWENQRLPGPNDNVKFPLGQDWSTRQQTVTIDTVVDARWYLACYP